MNEDLENINIYCRSMGKVFKVLFIAKNDNDANIFMKRHPDCGIIATHFGLNFIASFYPEKINITAP